MSELMIIGCGGTGINIMKDVIAAPGTKLLKEATYLGLDTSDRNSSDDLFPVVRMRSQNQIGQKGQGSGKDISLNYEGYSAFLNETFKEHKPPKFVIVIMSTAGGTGSGMGFSVLRYMLSRDIIVTALFIPDHTSLIEQRNSNKIMKAIANQVNPRYLGKVIPFIRVINDHRTRREINDEAILNLNYLSLFMTETNEEMDIEDIKNLFQYAEVTKLPPALSEINFLTDGALDNYQGKPPVAFGCLFDHRDNVRPLFKDSVYRTTGVINFDNNPPNNKVIVLTLDHGEAAERLEKDLEELEQQNQKAQATFIKQKDFSSGADADGIEW